MSLATLREAWGEAGGLPHCNQQAAMPPARSAPPTSCSCSSSGSIVSSSASLCTAATSSAMDRLQQDGAGKGEQL